MINFDSHKTYRVTIKKPTTVTAFFPVPNQYQSFTTEDNISKQRNSLIKSTTADLMQPIDGLPLIMI